MMWYNNLGLLWMTVIKKGPAKRKPKKRQKLGPQIQGNTQRLELHRELEALHAAHKQKGTTHKTHKDNPKDYVDEKWNKYYEAKRLNEKSKENDA